MNAKECSLFIVCMSLVLVPLAFGDASFDQVCEGNSHYAGGDYDKALESYENIQFDDDRGDQDKQRQTTVMYNRANCLYELDKPDEAVYLYQEAAMMSRDPALTNRIRFNLANGYCRQAIAQQQGNLQDAVDTVIKALRIYRDIKKAMPDDPDVRQNITVAAEALRALLEQQRQQEEQDQQQEEEQENLADKIKELLKRQKDLLIESSVLEQVEGPVDPNAATVSLGFSSNAIAQSQLSQNTTGLNEQAQGMMAQQLQQAMQQQQQQSPSPPALAPEHQKQLETLQVVSTELVASVEDQDEAALQFKQANVKDAIIGQVRSADHLQSALDALKDPQQQEQNQNKKDQQGENEDQEQQEQQEQQQGEQENQQADQQEKQGDQQQAKPEQQPEESEDEKMKATEALVRQILQMEKERRQEQKKQSRRRRAKVERDW